MTSNFYDTHKGMFIKGGLMKNKGRALLRGRPLSQDCRRAKCSGVEYTLDGVDYYGCYGLMDQPYNYNKECTECGAFVHTMPLIIKNN